MTTEKNVKITFAVGGKTEVCECPFGELPTYSGTLTPDGYAVAGWSKPLAAATGPLTYTAILTKGDLLTPAELYDAYTVQYIWFTGRHRQCGTEYFNGCTATMVMAVEEHRNPQAGPLRDRIIDQLQHVVHGHDPMIEALPFWSVSILCCAIAVSRATPTIWDALSADDQARLTCLMKAMAALSSYATGDENHYRTGPGLVGNYWPDSVNYRFANVPQILAAVSFFGGADEVNDLLRAFNFEETMAEFKKYGFSHAYDVWAAKNEKCSGGELLQNGGPAFVGEAPAGDGVGVIPRDPEGYKFKGHPLTECREIFDVLLDKCYAGGPVTKDSSCNSRGLNPDGTPICYTLQNGDENPVLGERGMIEEFNSGDASGLRSSGHYSKHDFIDSVAISLALYTLGLWEPSNRELARRAYVGNTDLIFKSEQGYMSFSKGKSDGVSYEEAYGGYYILKSVFQTFLAPMLK